MSDYKSCMLTLIALLLLGYNPLWAEDRVLIIGVGNFQSPSIATLPGISLDVSLMKNAAKQLGFEDRQIKTLLDREATLNNVEHAIQTWLVKDVRPEDRILLYISSHGTGIPDQNGDEPDGIDELLIVHDTEMVVDQDAIDFRKVLLDDRFHSLLKAIPSRNIIVLIDACYSGTVTKQLVLPKRGLLSDIEGTSKLLSYPGMPLAGSGDLVDKELSADVNYIALTSAQENQISIATPKGSIFTNGLWQTVLQAAQSKASLTPEQLHHGVTEFVSDNTPVHRVFQPQLSGNKALRTRDLFVVPITPGQGPLWADLVQTAERRPPLPIQINRARYIEGETLEISIDIPQDGYLNVINVGANDNATLLYPNQFHPDNAVNSGQLHLPTENMDFDLSASAPYGPSLIVAFLTSKPINLFASGNNLFSGGNIVEVFRAPSARGQMSLRTFIPTAKRDFMAGWVETRVCASAAQCR